IRERACRQVSARHHPLHGALGHGGQFGAPGRRFNAGHDLGMPPNVTRCYHAMALDETRLAFPLTRLSETDPDNGRLLEVWFRGLHADIGSGNGNRGINWISLNWLFENAR